MILDTLSNGLKDLFAALGAKTSDSNYAVPLLNKTNGTPQGMMDMASLASVLGAGKLMYTSGSYTSSNIDSITQTGIYFVNAGDYQPFNPLLVITKGNNEYMQVLFDYTNGIKIRERLGSSWKVWKDI